MDTAILTDEDIDKLDAKTSGKVLTDEDIDKLSSSDDDWKNKLAKSGIAQFTKGLYESVPFGKRVVGMLPNASEIQKTQNLIPQPTSVGTQVARAVGQTAPDLAMSTPFLRGAGLIPKIGKSAIAQGVTGLGAYGAAKAAVTGQPVLPTAGKYALSGAAYGIGGKAGATLIPKALPFAERIGTGIGTGLTNVFTGDPKEWAANFIFGAGTGSISPTERANVNKAIAPKLDFETIGERIGGIPRELTRIVKQFGWDDVKRAGQMVAYEKDPLTGAIQTKYAPNIAMDRLKQGVMESRKQASNLFEGAKEANKNTPVNPEELDSLYQKIDDTIARIGDPTSDITKAWENAKAKILGTELNYAEGSFSSGGGREATIKALPPQMRKQVLERIAESGEKQSTTLDALHNLAIQMGDYPRPGTYRNPRNMSSDEKIAMDISRTIKGFIGENNELYRQASDAWHEMKRIEDDVYDLSTKDLSKSWYHQDKALAADAENTFDRIDKHFINKGLSEFASKNLVKKYQAYQEWTSDRLASIRELLLVRIGLGAGAGATLGSLLGPGGKTAGATLGALGAFHYGRPKAYVPFLKELVPGSKGGKINPDNVHTAGGVGEVASKLFGG
jgi:hypothetical protein